MHLRWLQCAAVLLGLTVHTLVVPVDAALKELDAVAFQTMIETTPPPDTLVMLYTNNCPLCKQVEEFMEKLIKEGEFTQVLPDIRVMKQGKGGPLAKSLRISSFPALVLIRDDTTAFYTGPMDDWDEVYFWMEKAGTKRLIKTLTEDTFEHLTQASTGSTSGYWLVFFYRPSCQDHFPVLESFGINEKMWMSVAVVDLDSNPKLERRFKISSCPELIYFREGKMYRYETKKYDVPSITSFVNSWFRNVKASVVPGELTAFDVLTDSIAQYLKSQLEGENRLFTMAVLAGLAVTLVSTAIFCCLTGASDSKQKKE